MRNVLMMATFVLTAFGCKSTPSSPPPGDDKILIQGRWKVVFGEFGGNAAPAEEIQDVEFKIEGDNMTWVIKGEEEEKQKFTLDPAASPKQIDVTVERTVAHAPSKSDKPGTAPKIEKTETKTSIAKGVYELKDDTLTLCMDKRDDSPRPTSLAPTDRQGIVVLVLKRVK